MDKIRRRALDSGLKHSATDQMHSHVCTLGWPVYGEQSDDASGADHWSRRLRGQSAQRGASSGWRYGMRIRRPTPKAGCSETAWEFVDRMLACGGTYHALAKAALGMRLGIECGDARAPAAPLTPEQRSALEQLIHSGAQ